MITVEVTETGVFLKKVASDMSRLAKVILKKAVTHAKGRAELLTPVRTFKDLIVCYGWCWVPILEFSQGIFLK